MIAGQEVIFEPPDFERRLHREVCTKIVLRILLQKFERNIVNTQMWWPFICKLGLKRSYENHIFSRPDATAALGPSRPTIL